VVYRPWFISFVSMKKTILYFSRFSLFVVFFWFGLLKVIGLSPANALVKGLYSDTLSKTLTFLPFSQFIIVFGIFEMIIGLLFLIPRFKRLALILLGLHMITTFMPLFLLPKMTWQGFLVPTLEGQYILKNLVIISLALMINSVERSRAGSPFGL